LRNKIRRRKRMTWRRKWREDLEVDVGSSNGLLDIIPAFAC
jgi:hypothetical protein